MIQKILFTFLFLIFFCKTAFLYSKDNSLQFINKNWGLYSSYNIVFHNVNFSTFPGSYTCCQSFDNSIGNGISAGIIYQFTQSNNSFLNNSQVKIGISRINGDFLKQQVIGNTYDINNNTIDAISEYRLFTKLTQLDLQGLYLYDLGSNFNSTFSLNFAYIFSANFSQEEELISPDDARFKGASKIRNVEKNKEIANTNPIIPNIELGLNYSILIANNFIINPEIKFSYGISNITKDVDWKINQIKFGVNILALKEFLLPEKDTIFEIPKPIIIPENIVILDSNKIDSEFEIIEKESDLQNGKIQVAVDEYVSQQLYPLLTYIFFDENSSEIPQRYLTIQRDKTKEFDPEKYFANTEAIFVYHHILNIVGKRMIDNKQSKLFINGCNMNERIEKNNLKLSNLRALSIKKYLIDNWGIEENRLILKSTNLPEKNSSGNKEEHKAENRRVELSSDSYEILKPIFLFDTIQVANTTNINLKLKANNLKGISNWKIINNNENIFREQNWEFIEGFSNIDSTINFQFEINPKMELKNQKVEFDFYANNENGETKHIKKNIDIEIIKNQKRLNNKVNSKQVDEYRLIMFNFNSDEILESHKKILDLICENIKSNSSISIRGITDKLGNSDINKKLSEARAKVISQNLPCKSNIVNFYGIGAQPLYDNSIPEGRFYCRTVEVRVETENK